MGNIVFSCSGFLLFPGDEEEINSKFKQKTGEDEEVIFPSAPLLPLHGDTTRK